MAVSTIGVADADTPDKYLHTHSRTISATAREDQYIQQGWGAYPTYVAVAQAVSGATTADHMLQIMGDGTNVSRLLRLTITPYQSDAASALRIHLVRLTSAGTSGTAVTVSPYDTADTYAGAAAKLPSSKGTEGAVIHSWFGYSPLANNPVYPLTWEYQLGAKPIIFGTATSDGIAVKAVAGLAGALFDIVAEFAVTSYL